MDGLGFNTEQSGEGDSSLIPLPISSTGLNKNPQDSFYIDEPADSKLKNL
jgi:hypothetical protein